MAKYQGGVFGAFSGKIGNVVGSSWNGINYLKSVPRISKNRKSSSAQDEQKAKFALALGVSQKFANLFSTTIQPAKGETVSNQAIRLILARAVSGVYPNFQIEYSNLVVAKGTLNGIQNPTVASVMAGQLEFGWADNSGLGKAAPTDKALLVAYNEELNEVIYTVGSDRSSTTGTLDVSYFSGKMVHTWISFISSDGKLVANSIYAGTLMVL